MSIESTLERIASALEALASPQIAANAEAAYKGLDHANTGQAGPVKRGPGRPPKAVAAPAEVAAPSEPAATAPAQAPVAPAVATPSATTVTKEQTQNALVALIRDNKRDTVVKILGEHGAQSVSALAPEHYAAVYAKALAATPAA